MAVTATHRPNGAVEREKSDKAESCWLRLVSFPIIYALLVTAVLFFFLLHLKLRWLKKEKKKTTHHQLCLFNDKKPSLSGDQFYLYYFLFSSEWRRNLAWMQSLAVQDQIALVGSSIPVPYDLLLQSYEVHTGTTASCSVRQGRGEIC